jgi:hypothetical protein
LTDRRSTGSRARVATSGFTCEPLRISASVSPVSDAPEGLSRAVMQDAPPLEPKKAGDTVRCTRCGVHLVLVKRNGLWACDPGTKIRHACLDDRRR